MMVLDVCVISWSENYRSTTANGNGKKRHGLQITAISPLRAGSLHTVRCFCAVDVAAVMGDGGGGPARLFRTRLTLPHHHRRQSRRRRQHTCGGVGRGSRRCPLVTENRVGRRSKCLPLPMALYWTDDRRVLRSVAVDRLTRSDRTRQLWRDKSYSIYLFCIFFLYARVYFCRFWSSRNARFPVFLASGVLLWRPPEESHSSNGKRLECPYTNQTLRLYTAAVQVSSKWPNASCE